MADISLIQDDSLDDSDEGVFEQADVPSVGQLDNESLPPLLRVQKYALSGNFFDRQMVPRVLMELFRTSPSNVVSADLPQIMHIVVKLADDNETMVRTDLLEQIPNLSSAAKECSARIPMLSNILGEYLLPLVVRNLGTSENQVRKTAHSTLYILVEKGLLSKQQVEIQVCPTVLSLSNMESIMDCHTGAVTLMSRLAPFLGQEVTERVFLERFSQLCSNHMFYVRKVCASHFGDFCAVIGREAYEHVLLPCYITLCADDIWGVRKACAEVVMSVSCACPPKKRRSDLAPVFVKLLQDESRWVRMSAFQTLGPFISTFADPTITSMSYNNVGELVLVSNDGTEFRMSPTYTESHMYRSVGDVDLRIVLFGHEATNANDEGQNSTEKEEEDDVIFNSLVGLVSDEGDQCKEVKVDDQSFEADGACKENGDASGFHLPADVIEDDTLNNTINIWKCETNDAESENNNSVMPNSLYNNETVDVEGIMQSLKDALLNSNIKEFLNFGKSDQCLASGSQDDADECNSCDNLGSTFEGQGETTVVEDKLNNGHCSVANTVLDNILENLNHCSDDNKESSCLNNNCTKADEAENLEKYNSYNYWYVRPEMPLDPSLINPTLPLPPKQDHMKLENGFFEEKESFRPFTTFNITNASTSSSSTPKLLPYPKMDKPFTDKFSVYLQREQSKQDSCYQQSSHRELPSLKIEQPSQYIVPQLLIDHFVSMTDPNLAQNTDNEMAYHCAYSLPAVALTLGSKNWHLLKDTVEVLAANMQYKVRRTVASSLHELAMIVGPDIATRNLTPIFEGFIKDLDEVRIGVLKHLADFLRLISPPKRNMYLPRLAEFLQTDNQANWRFRQKLAEQLLLAVPLFCPGDATKHISNLAQKLLCDKVAAVREAALLLFAELVRYISADQILTSRLLVKLAEKFAHSKRWKWRQSFVLLCAELLTSQALQPEQFTSEVMPHLLDLSWDPVPNVRLVVARTLSQHIVTNEYFTDVNNQHYDGLQTVLRRLQSDKDRDVRQSSVFPKLTTVP